MKRNTNILNLLILFTLYSCSVVKATHVSDEGAVPVDEGLIAEVGSPPDMGHFDEGTALVDEGTAPVDEGTPLVDEGTPLVDEGTPLVDEGTPLVDEGTPLVDEGTPFVDEGTPLVDEGTAPVDEGTAPVDEGTPPVDEGAPPVDEGAPPVDEGAPPVDEGTPPANLWIGFNPEEASLDSVEFCLKGTMSEIDALEVINGTPASGVLEYLEGKDITFGFSFAITSQVESSDPFGGPFEEESLLILNTGPASLVFEGDDTGYLEQTVATAFEGVTFSIELQAGSWQQSFDIGNIVSPTGTEYWGLEGQHYFEEDGFELNEDGFPWADLPAGPFETSILLRRYSDDGGFSMTDYVHSSGTLTLIANPATCP